MLPAHLRILDVGDALQILYVARTTYIHYCLELQAVRHIVLITEIAAVHRKAACIVGRAEARMEVSEDVDYGLAAWLLVALC